MSKDISLIFWLWHNTMCRTFGFYGFHYTDTQSVSVAISILGGFFGISSGSNRFTTKINEPTFELSYVITKELSLIMPQS